MVDIGKFLIVIGVIIAVAGVVIWGLGRIGFRGLPGDIHYHSQHVRIYFPIITCIVLSIVLTFALWIWQWLTRR